MRKALDPNQVSWRFVWLLTFCLIGACLVGTCSVAAEEAPVMMQGREYASWQEFVKQNDVPGSHFRCSTPSQATRRALFPAKAFDPSDCSDSATNPTAEYDPNTLLEAKVVVHILMDSNCSQGAITDALVHSQMQILNEDFQALAGSNGAPGTNVNLRFVLADQDPQGNPHSGITRTCNTSYFQDGGGY